MMTYTHARRRLGRRPPWVAAMGCDDIQQYIEDFLDPHDHGGLLLPHEEAYTIAEEWLADLLADGTPVTGQVIHDSITLDDLAAYQIIKTACPTCRGWAARGGRPAPRFDESREQWMTYRGGWYPCPACHGSGIYHPEHPEASETRV